MTEENAYEREREQRIKRNNVALESLGISGLVPTGLRAASKKQKQPRSHRKAQTEEPADRRRSGRLCHLPAVVHTTFETQEDLGDHGRSRRAVVVPQPPRAAVHPAPTDGAAYFVPAVAPEDYEPPSDAPAGSCKAMRANVARMQADWLGRKVQPSDGSGAYKNAAMCSLCGRQCRFNKYSGIQEFANAVALFVNVRGKTGSNYANLFLEGGRRMTWFAQNTQHAESPTIKRILSCTGAAVDGKTPVVLFCREEGNAYVYMGRLAVDSYFPQATPQLKFVFKLVDFEQLREAEEVGELGIIGG